MQVESVDISTLLEDPSNARKHSSKNIGSIKGSLAKFGQQKPIVVGRNNVVIAGNGTLAAAVELDWKTINIVRTDLTGTEASAFAIADNRTAELAVWDDSVLAKTLEALQSEGFALDTIGFDNEDLKQWLKGTEVVPGCDEDEVPEHVEPRTKLGDLYQLGEHRLLCGDSTSLSCIDKLMSGVKADLCFTSPPYDQQRDYGVGKVSDWTCLMQDVFALMPVKESAQILINLGLIHKENQWVPYWDRWLTSMIDFGWRRFGLYVWDQGPGLPGDWNGRLAPSFEFIFHFNKETRRPEKTVAKKPENISPPHGKALRMKNGIVPNVSSPDSYFNTHKIPDSVIRIMRYKAGGLNHPAIFPVELPEEIITAYSNCNDSVYEPFLGSGSTLIACEKTKRKCYGMEIDPHYCDVILDRWRKYTGKEAKLDG